MQQSRWFVAPVVLIVGLLALSNANAFDPPTGGWDYGYEADADQAVDGAGFTALDGSFSHDNGSDQWDGSVIGAGRPGGAMILEDSYLRIQDTGDPRDHGMGDPGSIRKLYFGHDIGPDGIGASALDDGVTLNFRVRVPTTAPVDDIHPDGGGPIAAYPAGGDGYPLHNGAKGNVGIKQAAGGLVSFSLSTDDGALIMNGSDPASVDSAPNSIALDPTAWQDVWVVIRGGATAPATHTVDVYLNDSTVAQTFEVAAGPGNDFGAIGYIAIGAGATSESGALDIDFLRVKSGAHAPARGRILLVSDAVSTGAPPNNHDDSLIATLEAAGYVVDKSGMDGNFGGDFTLVQANLDAIDAADLIVVSRRTGSGSYNAARAAWNAIEKPLLLQSGYLNRNSRWGWNDGPSGDAALTTTDIDIVAGQEAHAFVAPFAIPITAYDLSAAPTPGQIPKGVFIPEAPPVFGGTSIGTFGGRQMLNEFPAGTEFVNAGGSAGGHRVFLANWGYDIQVGGVLAQWSDFTTPAYRSLFLNTISHMLGLGDDLPSCDLPSAEYVATTSGEGCDSGGNVYDIDVTSTGLGGPSAVDFDLPDCVVVTNAGGGMVEGEGGTELNFNVGGDGTVSFSVDISGCCPEDGSGGTVSLHMFIGEDDCAFEDDIDLECCRLIEPICDPEDEETPAVLAQALLFGSRALDCVTRDGSEYFMYHHSSNDIAVQATNGPDFRYMGARGHGFVVLDGEATGRRGWEQIGPWDDSPNNRNRYGDDCPEQAYDSFVGYKNHTGPCNDLLTGEGNEGEPCIDGQSLSDDTTYSASGGLFCIDVPRGFYRFTGIVGEADNPHSSRVLVQDGVSRTPGVIPEGVNHATLVHNHDQNQWDIGQARGDCLGCGVFGRIGFNCRIPPLGDGTPGDPVFVNLDENGMPTDPGEDGVFGTRDDEPADSPILEVTTGVITFHFLQGNATLGVGSKSNGTVVDVNGPDIVSLEIWRVFPGFDCPDLGDTHVTGVDVSEDQGGGGGEEDCTRDFIVTAFADDDSDDAISYSFSATDGVTTLDAGPQAENATTFTLTPGDWSITVSVDDDADCDDVAKDASVSVDITVADCGVGFVRSDANANGAIDLSDGIFLFNFLFLGGPAPPCRDAADTNAQGDLNITSGVFLLNFLFLGGPPPPPPFPDCETAAENLGCDSYPPCEI
jgi:hypothetical protein